MTLFRKIELGRQNMSDVVAQTIISGPIISSNNYDAIVTAFALLPKEVTGGLIGALSSRTETSKKKNKKQNKPVDTSKEISDDQGSPKPQQDSEEKTDFGGDARFVDRSLSPIAELQTYDYGISNNRSKMRQSSEYLFDNTASPSQLKQTRKTLGSKGAENFTINAES